MAENRVMPPGEVTKFREEMGITTRELAELVGASRTALLNWDKTGGPKYISLAFWAIRMMLKKGRKNPNTRIPA